MAVADKSQKQISGSGTISDDFFELKTRIHNRLIDLLDLSILNTLDENIIRSQLRNLVGKIMMEEGRSIPLNTTERERIYGEIEDEVLGLGPIEPFLKDDTISDILINTYRQIFIERRGRLELTNSRFKDEDHLMRIVDKIVSSVGRRIDESSPMVDARLQDGSRVNVIIPPLAIDGTIMSIRRFGGDPLMLQDLVRLKSLTPEIGELLEGLARARLNILISGGTGSGKTTLLNVVSQFIPSIERIVTIEDAAELQLRQDHVVRLETRPPNIEGKGEVTARDLVRNSLRMRPDRIIVGEVRGQEAFDMLQAMNTGHDGSLSTIHANSPRDSLMRLESMVAMSHLDVSVEFTRRYIASAIDLVIQVSRLADGTRKVISIQEITGMEGQMITMQEVFSFRQLQIDSDGNVRGHYQFHGVRPRFLDKFVAAGIQVPREIFSGDKIYEV